MGVNSVPIPSPRLSPRIGHRAPWLRSIPVDDEELKAAVIRAGNDEHGIALRRGLCEALTLALKKAGEALWICGSVIGSDRVDGASPFGFGSDATVALGTVVQIAGELSAGVITLLEQGNRYGAAALTPHHCPRICAMS
jgi:hypothetical protein